ncbi:putative NADH-ubiquinone oxidoreductase 9.5 kDa subunit [Piedraia hortae CBS 480.64]|uniref:Putative NADH-ubiquinone oxidoreductase 9.5 kDa subunit n=1 Tax=Piedraia hortae CBS 480.64 TaxID=1314780 RepID=A0A6A7BS79_9PEZI|nr:putative NADH-ubiquinone oxidoreductase 9.5 kDa subunit [Piedraia hortae CBS 480.64]
MAPVSIFENPGKYCVWAARHKPAIFWSCVLGCMGPIMLVTVPPLRQRFGDGPRPQIPLTYPIPKGPRHIPSGYDD